MVPMDASRRPTLDQLAWVFAPFGLAVAFAVFSSIATPAVAFARAQRFIWVSFLFAAPALALYFHRVRRAPLTNLWRLTWTASCLAYLAHFYYAYVVLFRGDFGAVFAAQGTLVAASNFAVTVLWAIDALLSWLTRRSPAVITWFRLLVHLLVLVSIVLSSVVLFKTITSLLLGLLVALAVVGALVVRWLSPEVAAPPVGSVADERRPSTPEVEFSSDDSGGLQDADRPTRG